MFKFIVKLRIANKSSSKWFNFSLSDFRYQLFTLTHRLRSMFPKCLREKLADSKSQQCHNWKNRWTAWLTVNKRNWSFLFGPNSNRCFILICFRSGLISNNDWARFLGNNQTFDKTSSVVNRGLHFSLSSELNLEAKNLSVDARRSRKIMFACSWSLARWPTKTTPITPDAFLSAPEGCVGF